MDFSREIRNAMENDGDDLLEYLVAITSGALTVMEELLEDGKADQTTYRVYRELVLAMFEKPKELTDITVEFHPVRVQFTYRGVEHRFEVAKMTDELYGVLCMRRK